MRVEVTSTSIEMDKVATLTILAIFSVTISYVVTRPVGNILDQNNNQEVQNTPGVSNHDVQVLNNMKNLLLRIMKRGGRGCIFNLGLSHNCDYEAAIGKGSCKKKCAEDNPFFNHFFLHLC